MTETEQRPLTRPLRCRYCKRMADMLGADNSRFDRTRFLKACGMED